jgi:hypothetical protein
MYGSPPRTLLERISRTAWEQVGKYDIQQWMAWLLARYSAAYASIQYRGLQMARGRGRDTRPR